VAQPAQPIARRLAGCELHIAVTARNRLGWDRARIPPTVRSRLGQIISRRADPNRVSPADIARAASAAAVRRSKSKG